MDKIEQDVKDFIREHFGCGEIENDQKIFELTQDSLDFLDMRFQIERKFNKEFQFELESNMTVEDIIGIVRAQIS